MAITKKTLKRNTKLSNNISRMQGLFAGKRALVVKDTLEGLEEVAVRDYYNVIILETDEGLESVPVPDYLFIKDNSVYRDSVLFIDKYFNNPNTIFVTNYDSVHMFKKLNSTLDMFNINYLPAGSGVSSSQPVSASLTPSGLDRDEPGVHLAMVLGCTSIYYTGSSDNATTVSLNDIKEFVIEKDSNQPLIPANFIATNRKTVLNTVF